MAISLIPKPTHASFTGETFTLPADTVINTAPETAWTAAYLAQRLRPATGYALPVMSGSSVSGHQPAGISLSLCADLSLGEEGYELSITPAGVILSACAPTGVFYAVQTLRQLLPAAIERADLQPGPWTLPCGTVRDVPRFSWRGVMLDVSRHFFGVADVQRYIDHITAYKMNRLHLHLSDDQGWRLEIRSWPGLTRVSGSTGVNSDPAGFYTQADYAEIVEYAAQRFVTVVPEIDTPGHTNAALAAYAELNADGVAREVYTGTQVGFSSLCAGKEITYRFLEDVVREIAALTPGPWIHIGGDEAASTPHEDYLAFIRRIQEIVRAAGKTLVGWEEIVQADLDPSSVAQAWRGDFYQRMGQLGVKAILSPAKRAYLDMKYNPATVLGLSWCGYVEVKDAYDWEPLEVLPGSREENILGVEGPLWSETVHTLADVESLAFPRLTGLAEAAWCAPGTRDWEDYRARLAQHGPRLSAMGINFHRSEQVDWEK
jgi:hexosaminidase